MVEDVVVRCHLQGLGIGRKMMEYAAEATRGFGGEKLVLSSLKERISAYAFYEHLGYKKGGFRFALILKRITIEVLMQKNIDVSHYVPHNMKINRLLFD